MIGNMMNNNTMICNNNMNNNAMMGKFVMKNNSYHTKKKILSFYLLDKSLGYI